MADSESVTSPLGPLDSILSSSTTLFSTLEVLLGSATPEDINRLITPIPLDLPLAPDTTPVLLELGLPDDLVEALSGRFNACVEELRERTLSEFHGAEDNILNPAVQERLADTFTGIFNTAVQNLCEDLLDGAIDILSFLPIQEV
jgi:hypothetical protein